MLVFSLVLFLANSGQCLLICSNKATHSAWHWLCCRTQIHRSWHPLDVPKAQISHGLGPGFMTMQLTADFLALYATWCTWCICRVPGSCICAGGALQDLAAETSGVHLQNSELAAPAGSIPPPTHGPTYPFSYLPSPFDRPIPEGEPVLPQRGGEELMGSAIPGSPWGAPTGGTECFGEELMGAGIASPFDVAEGGFWMKAY